MTAAAVRRARPTRTDGAAEIAATLVALLGLLVALHARGDDSRAGAEPARRRSAAGQRGT